MKKIIVPSDFSENAYAALHYASKLYGDEPMHIVVLHSYSSQNRNNNNLAGLSVKAENGKINPEEESKKLLQKIELNTPKQKHNYEFILTPESLSSTINKMVKEDEISLVVMGDKGRTSAEDVLVGSTTIKVLKSLENCPLLIVPNHVKFVVPLKIGFASDYKEFFSFSKFKPITRLVRQFNSQIHIINVGTEKELDKTQKENYDKFIVDLTEYDVDFHFVPKKGNISNTLHSVIAKEDIDLFTIIHHKHNFIKQLFREPVVSRIGKHDYVPLLVIPSKSK
ncbi:universal stress protein [Aequorivita sinensis]|uniref:universal stress protein n=1 Tax=Aequorivita sinensis TaxID=1382458 RepID=UPI0023019F00|nr:universal stress protein [Aequorivita sinensis]